MGWLLIYLSTCSVLLLVFLFQTWYIYKEGIDLWQVLLGVFLTFCPIVNFWSAYNMIKEIKMFIWLDKVMSKPLIKARK